MATEYQRKLWDQFYEAGRNHRVMQALERELDAPLPPPPPLRSEFVPEDAWPSLPASPKLFIKKATANGWAVRVLDSVGPRLGGLGLRNVLEPECHTLGVSARRGPVAMCAWWRETDSVNKDGSYKWVADSAIGFQPTLKVISHTDATKYLQA
ncbi:hypothetical protein EDD28_0019 [Salana multivorans]|uniref:Uncharacterized protein n=1 Tax=Salana multivorans TaxID=120377 RepID=A0A3N2D6Q8_9MICO|nr:hypothetical protein [Salana multivorans]ROR93080.1 hypothetical protein EDD28_2485 [Salana multivorans]ROR95466.1 hypothetical protein EDD28_0019 [Salana multivorans]